MQSGSLPSPSRPKLRAPVSLSIHCNGSNVRCCRVADAGGEKGLDALSLAPTTGMRVLMGVTFLVFRTQ